MEHFCVDCICRGRNCERCPECLLKYQPQRGRAVQPQIREIAKSDEPQKIDQKREVNNNLPENEDFCLSKYKHSCLNGGQCVNSTRESFQCLCPSTWKGIYSYNS